MSRPMRSTDVRKAAINASTVFAITLAIIAGLICAWVFKTVFLKPKEKPQVQAAPTYRVSVMGANITENATIQGLQIKRITVDEKKYQEFKAKEKDRGEMLTGSQPIGRVTKKALVAEEPVYAEDVKPLHYPKAISEMLEPGKAAVIVEVPSKDTMAREGDRVDVLCTLSNTDPELGPTETRTAVMAKDVRVLARFLTTADAARPSRTMSRSQNRPFTIEVTPYRQALIELAKSIGGAFTLTIHRKDDGTGVATTVAAASQEAEDPKVDRVTTEDLAKLFGFAKPLPPRYFEVEKFSGVDQVQGAHIFLEPGSPRPSSTSSSRQNQPGGRGPTGGLQGPNSMRPGGGGMPPGGRGGMPPGGRGGQPQMPAPGGSRPSRPQGASSNRQASVSGDMGLKASGWQRIASDSNGQMMNSNRVGGLARGNSMAGRGGNLTGPNTMALNRAMRAQDCPNCGHKR